MKFRVHSILLISISFFLMGFSAKDEAHKYYVSTTDIEQAKKGNNLQITIRLFIDDFEDVLQERYDDAIVLNEQNSSKSIETIIGKYLNKKLTIKVNGIEAKLSYLGKEFDNDIVKCYVEIVNTEEIKNVSITNQLLFDLFEEQQNIVHLRLKGKRKSFVLIKENDKGMLNF
ncbi:DUF6702 family protein [Spongiivirga sp. MCCC 1A20706]|uniref:DUF6702 family protein n=1 Tax=Spongiivirga sp. MCCC 1A20706 TaxID=3160963 RepID=UPI0039775811